MKSIVNHTPFEAQVLPFSGPLGQPVATVVVKATFEYLPEGTVLPAKDQIPIKFGDEPYPDSDGGIVKFEADIAPFKPRADIVLVGKAYAPKSRMVQCLDVRVRVGAKQKIIRIFGDRKWNVYSRFLKEEPSTPIPFREMDITYDRAYGGIDMQGGGYCPQNTAGIGFLGDKSKNQIKGQPLPNIEDPNSLIRNRKSQPLPAGFGFYGKSWMPRLKYLGTYDQAWTKERAPKPPQDFSFEFYNCAHPDLQVEGYLKGDEEVVMQHVSVQDKIRFNLPGYQLDCQVVLNDTLQSRCENIEMNLDTLCLLPEENRFFLIWRGTCPINDLSGSQIEQVELQTHRHNHEQQRPTHGLAA